METVTVDVDYKPRPFRNYYIIRKGLSWRQISGALGRPEFPKWAGNSDAYPCGLAGGGIETCIYRGDFLKGFSDKTEGSPSFHVTKHSDGVCVTGSLNVELDDAGAKEAAEKLDKLEVKG